MRPTSRPSRSAWPPRRLSRAYNKSAPRLAFIFDNKAYVDTFFVKNPKSGGSDEETGDETLPVEAEAPTGA